MRLHRYSGIPQILIDPSQFDVRPACITAAQTAASTFRKLEKCVPPPRWMTTAQGQNWCYQEKSPSQALILKMARELHGLRAVDFLLANGFSQEVGVLVRMLDEINQDIEFLSYGLAHHDWTPLHVKYLQHFWSVGSDDFGREHVQRKKIRAYVVRARGHSDTSTAYDVDRALYETFSSFVHAKAESIIELISGPPPIISLGGEPNPNAVRSWAEHMPSYYFRALGSGVLVSRALEQRDLFESAYQSMRQFGERMAPFLFNDSETL